MFSYKCDLCETTRRLARDSAFTCCVWGGCSGTALRTAGPDTRSFELVSAGSMSGKKFANLERDFIAHVFLSVDDVAAICAMRPGESVVLGSDELRRHS